jgi:hypothetical protein
MIELLKRMRETGADAVIGSKMERDSILNYPATRKFLSKGYYFLIRVLFKLPFKDTQTGIKLFKYEALKSCILKINVNRYAFDLELLVLMNKKGYKIVESPIYLKTKRRHGRIGIRDVFTVFFDTIAIFYRLYLKRSYN